MPFFKNIKNADGQIGIWKFSETPNDLQMPSHFTPKEKAQFKCINAKHRKKEFLAVRYLLKKMLGGNVSIQYNDNGKPSLNGSLLNISISHSADFACIFLSTKNIGIDIEQIHREIDKVAPRFLHPQEIDFIEQQKDQQLTKIFYWSAKEAIYKCAGLQNIQFREMILIHPFNIEKDQRITAHLKYGKKKVYFRLNFTRLENNVLVYAVPK